jgi:hypothetical protein
MIGFLTSFARRARDFTAGSDRPAVWVELHPHGLLVRAVHKGDRCNHILSWEEIDRCREELRDHMIDYAIMKAVKPILDRQEA